MKLRYAIDTYLGDVVVLAESLEVLVEVSNTVLMRLLRQLVNALLQLERNEDDKNTKHEFL